MALAAVHAQCTGHKGWLGYASSRLRFRAERSRETHSYDVIQNVLALRPGTTPVSEPVLISGTALLVAARQYDDVSIWYLIITNECVLSLASDAAATLRFLLPANVLL